MGERYMKHNVLERILDGRAEPTNLPLPLLHNITEGFSAEREIGHGGFGVVYKGSLQNGIVAVKKAFSTATTEDKQFNSEANCLLKVKHQNIVRFLGYCSNTEHKLLDMGGKLVEAEIRERLLCFEYISNGSLKKHLTDELRGLEWHTRYQIIKGICEGLRYLHEEKHIVHRDLKPDNVLLDDLMVPKITDFGISRLLDGASQAITTNRSMTIGYCAPEMIHGEVSFRSDIYSLGVVIIEIVTGRKQYDFNVKNVLRRWRYRWNKSGKETPLEYQVTKCIEIGRQCLEVAKHKRPSISDIIRDLNKLGSADGQSSKAHESTVGQIIPDWNDLLGIDPLQLYFPSELNKEISCSVQLSNQTDDYIAFNIQKRSELEYSTQPDKDVVPPRSKCSVNITLHGPSKAPQDTPYPEFVVQSTKVNEGLTAEDITEDMFEVGKEVDEVILTVVYDAPPLPGEPKVHTGNPNNHREASNEPQLSAHEGSVVTTSQFYDGESILPSKSSVTSGPFSERGGDSSRSNQTENSRQLLDVHPTELFFPFEPNKLISCSLQMTNNGDDRVAFRLLAKNSRRYLEKLPLCGVVPPRCTYILALTMRKRPQPPSSNSDFFTLQSIELSDLDLKDSIDVDYDNFFKEAEETAGDEVRKVTLTVACRPGEEATSAQPNQSGIMIISTQHSRKVLSVDVHPTDPWIMTSNHGGNVCIWNYEMMETVNSFEVSVKPVYSAKFIAREQWFVAGDGNGCIHVYNYDTMKKDNNFVAHRGRVTSLAVHPTRPYVLSSSDDHLIKLWDWEKGWECTRTFHGHSNRVAQLTFNPNDTNRFTSASWDRKAKIWTLDSPDPDNTLDGHSDDLTCVDYGTGGDRRYLLTGSKDGTAQIWDMEKQKCIRKLEGHADRLSAVYWHPELPILTTGSLDGTVRIWNSTTYRLENVISFNVGAVYAFVYIKGLRRIVVGCHERIAMMEINLQ